VNSEPEYRVKWHRCSYRYCQFVPRQLLERIAVMKLLRFERKHCGGYTKLLPQQVSSIPEDEDDYGGGDESDIEFCEGIHSDWIQVDRVISLESENSKVLVKWRGLGYKESTWETISTLNANDRLEIDRFRIRVQQYQCRAQAQAKTSHRRATLNAGIVGRGQIHLDKQPTCLKGGILYDYQLEGLNWMLGKRGEGTNVILADEMGLGKTIQIASFVGTLLWEEPINLKPFLIVVPLSTFSNWKREIESWCPHINFVAYSGNFDDRKLIRETEFDPQDIGVQMFDVLCTSYELAVQDRCFLRKIEWESLIVDEGHRLKGGNQSILFETLCDFKAKQRILVTGTPLQNNLEELFNLMKFLGNREQKKSSLIFPSLEEFARTHIHSTPDEKIESLKVLLRPYVLRRLKKDQSIDLAPKIERIIPLHLSALQKKYYSAILTRNYRVLKGESKSQRRISLLNVLMELRKCCIHPFLFDNIIPEEHSELSSLVHGSSKLQFLDQILPHLKKDGHRVLIFSQFTRMLDILETYLERLEYSYLRIDGTVHGEDRQKRIDAFNDPQSSVFIFLLSTRAGGLGINLAAADTVVIFDSDFNPHRDIQALSRAHRIGQQRTVLVLRLVCKSTVEEGILRAANKKLALESVVVNSLTNNECRTLSREDLELIIAIGAEDIVRSVPSTSAGSSIEVPCTPGASNSDHKIGCNSDLDSTKGQDAHGSSSQSEKNYHTAQTPVPDAEVYKSEDILRFLVRYEFGLQLPCNCKNTSLCLSCNRANEDSCSLDLDDILGPFQTPSSLQDQETEVLFPFCGCE
jgi:chromodomain-helicase-DNA-binding protein 4